MKDMFRLSITSFMFEKTLAEKILKEVRKELQARIELAKEELRRYSEQLNAVNEVLEELKKLFFKRKEDRIKQSERNNRLAEVISNPFCDE